MAVVQNIRRADRAVVDRLDEHGVATIHEAQGRRGLLDPGITPVWPWMGLTYTEQDETG